MAERYSGAKFETVFLRKEPLKSSCIKELILWCRKFSEMGIAPRHETGSYGNMSARTDKGFLITGAGTDLGKIKACDFTEVVSVSGKRVETIGLVVPSSETMLHNAIYSTRLDVSAVFHGHDSEVLKNVGSLGIPVTEKEEPYGTPELAEQAGRLCRNDYFVLKDHGIVSLGRTMKEAGERAVRMHEHCLLRAAGED